MNVRPRALVVLNPRAHGGAGARRYAPVRPLVESTFDAITVVGDADGRWHDTVHAALDDGVRVFVAAGGDGTAHAVLGALVAAPRRPELEELALGAVGLGSSNDLHKPAGRGVSGMPLRLDVARAAPRDVLRCTYTSAANERIAYVLVSASLGLVAAANARFNRDTRLARALRRRSTAVAIAWAAAATLAQWRNLPATLRMDDGPEWRVALSSLGVLKTEWLSGALHFGHGVAPDSGDFDVALAHGLSRARLLLDMLALLRGRFDGRPGHARHRACVLDVRLDAETPIEFDGEIASARSARFDVFPERIRLCAA